MQAVIFLPAYFVYKCEYKSYKVKYIINIINLFVHICTNKLKYIHLQCDNKTTVLTIK